MMWNLIYCVWNEKRCWNVIEIELKSIPTVLSTLMWTVLEEQVSIISNGKITTITASLLLVLLHYYCFYYFYYYYYSWDKEFIKHSSKSHERISTTVLDFQSIIVSARCLFSLRWHQRSTHSLVVSRGCSCTWIDPHPTYRSIFKLWN